MSHWLSDLASRVAGHPLLARQSSAERAWDVIGWWEVRRVPYNLVVGTAGLLSGVVAVVAAVCSEAMGGEPLGMPDGIATLLAPVLVAVGANLCYTAGWVVELAVRRLWRAESRAFAPMAFATGLAFSVAVVLLPALLAIGYLLMLAAGGVRPGPGSG